MKFAEKQDIIHSVKPGLKPLLTSIKKDFGTNSIMWFGEEINPFTSYDVVDTGLFSLNAVVGNHGIVKGRQLEIFGPESSGKTTLMLYYIAMIQRLGGLCAFVDYEHSFDPTWAIRNYVDLESLLISQPDSAEEALSIVERLTASGQLDAVVLDSVGGLNPKVVQEKTAEDKRTVSPVAGMLTDTVKRVNDVISKNKCIMCWINQIRDKIDTSGYGGPKTDTPGGHVLKHYCTYRLDVKRIETIKQDGIPIGIKSMVKAIKNKAASPYREANIEIMFDEVRDIWGIWTGSDLFTVGDALGIFDGGRVRSFGGETVGDGIFNCKVALTKNAALADKVRSRISTIYNYGQIVYYSKKLAEVAGVKTVTGSIAEQVGVAGIDTKKVKGNKAGKVVSTGDKEKDALLKQLAALGASGVDLESLAGAASSETVSDAVPVEVVQEPVPPAEPVEVKEPEMPDISQFMPKFDDDDFNVEIKS